LSGPIVKTNIKREMKKKDEYDNKLFEFLNMSLISLFIKIRRLFI
jgi:hypothetical protein